jgi:hypothetical protein
MVNISKILASCKNDYELLIVFLKSHYSHYSLTFDKTKRAGKGGAIRIYQNSVGEYSIQNHNPSKYDIPIGNISAQLKHITKDIDGFERVKRQIEILESLGVEVGEDTADPPTAIAPSATAPIAIITPPLLRINELKAKSTKIILEYESFTTTDNNGGVVFSKLGKAVHDYFDNKCGVTLVSADAVYQSFGIRPIKSKTIIGAKKTSKFFYTPNDFAFSYSSGGALKIKQPYQKKFKNIWVHNVHDYVFGYDAICGDDDGGDICLICGGEDDAICINTHFCDMPQSIVAVAVGSETKPINPLLVERLHQEFKTVAICFDFDDVGLHHAAINAEKLNIPFLDFCNAVSMMGYEPYQMKDVCDIYHHTTIKNGAYDDFMKIVKYTIQESI